MLTFQRFPYMAILLSHLFYQFYTKSNKHFHSLLFRIPTQECKQIPFSLSYFILQEANTIYAHKSSDTHEYDKILKLPDILPSYICPA